MMDTDTSPKVTAYLTAPTSCETVGVSATVVQGGLFDILKNATWVLYDLPTRVEFDRGDLDTGVGEGRIKARDLGWTQEQVASLKARQSSFREEWNAPGMDAYNAL